MKNGNKYCLWPRESFEYRVLQVCRILQSITSIFVSNKIFIPVDLMIIAIFMNFLLSGFLLVDIRMTLPIFVGKEIVIIP